MKSGVELIAIEREEQIKKHGRSIEKDVIENPNQELRKGAVALLTDNFKQFPMMWDETICEKMFAKSYEEKLIIAGAFIAAELDRINSLNK